MCHEDLARTELLFKELQKRKIIISIDVNARPQSQDNTQLYYKAIKRLLEYADIIKLSEEDIHHVYDSSKYSDIAKQLLDQGASLIALTFGDKGAQLLNQTEHVECTGYQCTDIIDTIGSGDIFIAALISWLLNQYPQLTKSNIKNLNKRELQLATHYACAAATINIGRRGCQPPTIEEINAHFKALAIDLHSTLMPPIIA